jgi:hypothetical protein
MPAVSVTYSGLNLKAEGPASPTAQHAHGPPGHCEHHAEKPRGWLGAKQGKIRRNNGFAGGRFVAVCA